MARPVIELKLPKGKPLTPELAFAIVLRERRIALGLTQADLEDDEEIDRSYISKLELGKRQIALRGIIHIARKLNMKPEELMAAVVARMEESRERQ